MNGRNPGGGVRVERMFARVFFPFTLLETNFPDYLNRITVPLFPGSLKDVSAPLRPIREREACHTIHKRRN